MLQAFAQGTDLSRLYVQLQLPRYGHQQNNPGVPLSGREARLRAAVELGFGGVVIPAEWARVERVRGHRDWARLDSIVEEAASRHLAMYGIVSYSPPWAVPPAVARMPRSDSHRPVVDGSAARGDTLFASFAAAVARRYRDRLDRWEVWNEENHPDFWFNVTNDRNQGPSAEDYYRLFTLARDSIVAANPKAKVAIGGLSSFSGRRRAWPDPLTSGHEFIAKPAHEYLRDLLRLGARPENLAIHPYSVLPPGGTRWGEGVPIFPDQVVDSVFGVLNGAGLLGSRVWVTEWGVDAVPSMSPEALTLWFQVALHDLLCHPRIEFVTIYALTDESGRTHFGLMNSDGSRTADGVALERAMRQWVGCRVRAAPRGPG